jgi:hypothetical protein
MTSALYTLPSEVVTTPPTASCSFMLALWWKKKCLEMPH